MAMSQEILNILYTKYFENGRHYSAVTSSHWREVGSHQVVRMDDKWQLKGSGFGDRLNNTWKNRFRRLPAKLLVNQMLRHHGCPSRLIEYGEQLAFLQDRVFDYDCAKQLLAIDQIVKTLGGDSTIDNPLSVLGVKDIAVIGDGYGYMGALLARLDKGVTITSINLGSGLFFDVYYTVMSMPKEKVKLLDGGAEVTIGSDRLRFLEAEHYSMLSIIPVDLYINIASMQEMELSVVNSYMQYMRNGHGGKAYFYCCNRVEKELPDGQCIKLAEYGWSEDDEVLLDELCPWYQKYPKSMPPGWYPFDGPIQHRLVKLAKVNSFSYS
jgi:hypothetical protein